LGLASFDQLGIGVHVITTLSWGFGYF
jgi:hypothetical protein